MVGVPKLKSVVWPSGIALLIIAGVWGLATRSLSWLPTSAPSGTHGLYATDFSRTENPISEGGQWLNGQTDGLDWTDVRTTPGFAFGTEAGGNRPDLQKYDDSTAILKGTWRPNQTVPGYGPLGEPESGREGLGGSGVAPAESHFSSPLYGVRNHVPLL